MRIVTRLTDLRQRLAASQSTQAQLAEALVAEVACTGLGLGDFPKHFTPPRRLTRPEPPHVKRDPPSLTLEPVAPPRQPVAAGGSHSHSKNRAAWAFAHLVHHVGAAHDERVHLA